LYVIIKIEYTKAEKQKILRRKLVLNYKFLMLCALVAGACPAKAVEKEEDLVVQSGKEKTKSTGEKFVLVLKATGCGFLSLFLGAVALSTLNEEYNWLTGKKKFSEFEPSLTMVKGCMFYSSYEAALKVLDCIRELKK
jgi:hypothetical protein